MVNTTALTTGGFGIDCARCHKSFYNQSIDSTALVDACSGEVALGIPSTPAMTIYMGVKLNENDINFAIGAIAQRGVLFTPTAPNSPVRDEGSKFYFTPYNSMGFMDARASLSWQFNGDRTPLSDPYSSSRVSWILDKDYGGYRIGTILNLEYDTSGYTREMYICTSNPTAAPTPLPTPVRQLNDKSTIIKSLTK